MCDHDDSMKVPRTGQKEIDIIEDFPVDELRNQNTQFATPIAISQVPGQEVSSRDEASFSGRPVRYEAPRLIVTFQFWDRVVRCFAGGILKAHHQDSKVDIVI